MEQDTFNIVIAKYSDGQIQLATAINHDEVEKLNLERLEHILEVQRLHLLELGDEASKDEAETIGALIVEYKDNDIVFMVAKEPITREGYIKMYTSENRLKLLENYEYEYIK